MQQGKLPFDEKSTADTWYIFTDGACSGNPGPGGWGAVIIGEGHLLELGGGRKSTTNNRMELTAAAESLARVPEEAEVILWTDSSYLIDGITKWLPGWKKNGWRKKDGALVLNVDLWKKIETQAAGRVRWNYVPGHKGYYLNERCDTIAVAFSQGKPAELRDIPLDKTGDAGLVEAALKDALDAGATAPPASSGKRKPAPKGKKRYLFAWNGRLYRFDSWPACSNFTSGKPGYPKACRTREEEIEYAKKQGLGPEAVDSAVRE